MANYHKKQDPSDLDQSDNEIIRDQVKHIFKNHPGDYISKLEEIGFVYHDDDPDPEEQEEATAKAENSNQEYLVSFFNGDIHLSNQTVDTFLEERRSPRPNLALFRKYFKAGNKHLLSMILHGLHHYPVSDELLSDLSYFHEFHGILQILINQFMEACERQENLQMFSDLAMDFYYATAPDGYDALYALKEKFPVGSDKRKVIDFLIDADIDNVDVDETF